MQFISFDSHKRYTLASVEDGTTGESQETRIVHERGNLREFLGGCEAGSAVAVETIGNWYWIVDEIEEAGFRPQLVHARKAKLMMGMINKTDKLDARGLNRLQRNRTLPTVWIPPGEIRDQRDLTRTRMVLVRQRTQVKNRIHAALARYALPVTGVSDVFGVRGSQMVREHIKLLPPHTAFATELLMEELESLNKQIRRFEARMKEIYEETEEIKLLMTLPGIGFNLAIVVGSELGRVERFPSAERFASYAGVTPRVHSSGGRTRTGGLRSDVNRYLQWAFIEAANTASMNRRHCPARHVCRLYDRVAGRRNHHKAIGAVARHLAEAAYWVLKKKEPYLDPGLKAISSTKG